MTNDTGRARVADNPAALDRLERLLLEYPAVSPSEQAEIGQLLRATGPLDMGLLSANAHAWERAEHYRRDHPRLFRMGLKERLFWIVAGVGTILTLYLVWDIGIA